MLRKEVPVNGAEGAGGAAGVHVRAKVRWSLHRIHLRGAFLAHRMHRTGGKSKAFGLL